MKTFVIRKTSQRKGGAPPEIRYCSESPELVQSDPDYRGRSSMGFGCGAFYADLDKNAILFEECEKTRDILGWLRCEALAGENEYWHKPIYDLVEVNYSFFIEALSEEKPI